MSKRRFIRDAIIRLMPNDEKFDQALEHAETLWGKLENAGYGETKPSEPRESVDWYAKLNARQRKWFGAFWVAFSHKYGRNGAAMRWYQLGELTDEEYQQIVDAAGKEAKKPLPPGQSRKMAQGWLQERRYFDYLPDKSARQSDKNHILRRLQSQLTGARKLYESSGDPALAAGIERIEKAIAEAKK